MKSKNLLRPLTKILIILGVLISVGSVNHASASHVAGGEIYYDLVPNTTNQYVITFRLFRDCGPGSAPAPGASVTMCYWNDCNFPKTGLVLPKLPIVDAPDTGCPNVGTECTDPTSVIPGYEVHYYQATVTLPQACNKWTFAYGLNARNNQDWIGPAQGSYYTEVTFDNTLANLDSSPRFLARPVPYCCINQQFNGVLTPFDPDGDSLVIESVRPLNGPTSCTSPTPISAAPYDHPAAPNPLLNPNTNPIPTNNSFVLNTSTGAHSFTPNIAGTGTMAFKCYSYRNGVLIGTVIRDVQIAVLQNCPIVPTPGTIDSTTVVGGYVNPTRIETCLGDSVSFCAWITSSDPLALLKASDNAATAIPGAVTNYSGIGTDSVEMCFGWQTTILDTGLHVLTLNYVDTSCLPPGILLPQFSNIEIFVNYATLAEGDTTLCVGDSTQLSASGGGPFTWSVLPGGSPISSLSCTQCDNPWVKPTLPTYYVVEGCTKDTVFVDALSVPNLTITPDVTTCVNADLQLNVSATPGSQPYDYAWTPATFLNNPNIANPICVMPNPTGNSITYTATVIPRGMDNNPYAACASTASVTVSVLKGFEIDPYDTILCDGESTTITGTASTVGADAYTFNWTPVGDMTPNNTLNTVITPAVPGGNYTVTASFPGCPDSSITIPVVVDALPVVDAGMDREMCLNDTIHLNSSVIPNTPNYYTITWTPGADMNSSAVANPVYRGKITQTLNVTYTTPNGCEDDDNVLITVNNVDFLQLDGDRTLCPGDTATLSVLGALSYSWSPDYFISNTGNVSTVRVYPQASQQYQVVGIDNKGCYDTAHVNVVVNPGSVVDAGEDVTIYPGERVTLYADGNCSLFDWFPPSGLSDTKIKNPVAQPTATTRYYVNAETENGCPTMDSVTVIVSNESLIDLPNVFSPGSGTSLNDRLMIRRRGDVKLKRWDIFNRWGQKVFSTTNIEEGWDGRFKSEPQPLGTYVYMIEAVTNTGKRFYKQGNVTLIR